jgi:hypothetical protein
MPEFDPTSYAKASRNERTMADIANKVNTLGEDVSDETFNAPWKSGTPTIDPATGIITLADHGFNNKDPIEFDAGTGVLPTGILPYNCDANGGMYYNVIAIDANTFKITSTLGSTTALIPTDAGTAGWKIRHAGCNVGAGITTLFELPINDSSKHRLYITGRFAQKSTTADDYAFYFDTGFNYFGSRKIINGSGKKFSYFTVTMTIQRLSANEVIIKINTTTAESDDKAAYSLKSNTSSLVTAIHDIPITIIGALWGNGNGFLRNGLRVKHVKGC